MLADEKAGAADEEDAHEDEKASAGDAAPSAALDPKTRKRRLLSCSRCRSPVASSAWSGRVLLRCGYCSFEDERELILTMPTPGDAAPDPPYRGKGKASATTTKIEISLVEEIAAFPTLDAEKLHTAIARRPVLPEDLPTVEWERVWIGIFIALRHAMATEPLQARVTLETTLEATRTPAYRALLLAHLAQHAAAQEAPALAKKWLRACPQVAIAEVESEIRAARAFVALAEGRLPAAQRLTGDARSGAGFTGWAVIVARAINVEAHERAGERALADAIMNDLRRKKGLAEHGIAVAAYRLGLASLARVTRRAAVRSTLSTAITSALPFVVALFIGYAPTPTFVAGILAVAAACGANRITMGWRASGSTRGAAAFRRTLCVLVELACVALPMSWLVHANPLRSPVFELSPDADEPAAASPPPPAGSVQPIPSDAFMIVGRNGTLISVDDARRIEAARLDAGR